MKPPLRLGIETAGDQHRRLYLLSGGILWTPIPKLKGYDECFPFGDQVPYRDLIGFGPNAPPYEYGTGPGVTLPKSKFAEARFVRSTLIQTIWYELENTRPTNAGVPLKRGQLRDRDSELRPDRGWRPDESGRFPEGTCGS